MLLNFYYDIPSSNENSHRWCIFRTKCLWLCSVRWASS